MRFVCAFSRSRDVATRQNSRTAPLILPSERSLHDLLVVDLRVRSRGATFGADLPLPGLRVRQTPDLFAQRLNLFDAFGRARCRGSGT